MLKAFCDCCGENGSMTSRQFANLHDVDGEKFGLEVRLLYNSQITPDHHICGECMPVLLLEAAKMFPESLIMKHVNAALIGSQDYNAAKRELIKRSEALTKKEQEIEATLEAALKKEKALKERATMDAERIAVLETQVQNIKATAELKIKQVLAAKKQEEIDSKENPDYVSNVKRREFLRAGG